MDAKDAPFIYALLNTKEWIKYIGDRKIHSLKDAEDYIVNMYQKMYTPEATGSLKVELKDTGESIGTCGLLKRSYLDVPDLGFAFLPQFFGKGYGFEASMAVLDYARDHLNLGSVQAFTVEYNVASRALLTKLGMKEAGTIRIPGDPEELLLYTLSLNDFTLQASLRSKEV
jgi:RimJ/RimL family protein N-acetyltransferase